MKIGRIFNRVVSVATVLGTIIAVVSFGYTIKDDGADVSVAAFDIDDKVAIDSNPTGRSLAYASQSESAVDMVLQNKGSEAALITEVELVLLRAHSPGCWLWLDQADVEATYDFDVTPSEANGRPVVYRKSVRFKVEGGEFSRLRVNVNPVGASRGGFPTFLVFGVYVKEAHKNEPMEVGRGKIVAPSPSVDYFREKLLTEGSASDCGDGDSRKLKRLDEYRGVESPEWKEIMRHL